jgi:hypothetical protein
MNKIIVFSALLAGLSGVFLWAQQWQQVGILTLGADKGETVLIVEWVSPGMWVQLSGLSRVTAV